MAVVLRRKTQQISGSRFVDRFVLNATQINDKEVTLTQTPTVPSSAVVHVVGGSSQIFNFDYGVIGNIITWDGFAMETILEENDTIIIIYN